LSTDRTPVHAFQHQRAQGLTGLRALTLRQKADLSEG